VLEAKINLFELVVGELDMILGRVDDDFDFESSVFDAYVGARDDEEFVERLAQIGEDLAGKDRVPARSSQRRPAHRDAAMNPARRSGLTGPAASSVPFPILPVQAEPPLRRTNP